MPKAPATGGACSRGHVIQAPSLLQSLPTSQLHQEVSPGNLRFLVIVGIILERKREKSSSGYYGLCPLANQREVALARCVPGIGNATLNKTKMIPSWDGYAHRLERRQNDPVTTSGAFRWGQKLQRAATRATETTLTQTGMLLLILEMKQPRPPNMAPPTWTTCLLILPSPRFLNFSGRQYL